MQLLYAPPEGSPLVQPCVDCGLKTGNFCDGVEYDNCFAADRVPADYADDHGFGKRRTPLCSYCEARFKHCRFCRGVSSCTPPARRSHWSDIPLSESRSFTADTTKSARLGQLLAKVMAEQAEEDTS